ncbi:MAG: NAD(P)H-dependent glycerol-3-phosphate dehydrogenase [Dehalococcoidia bacterium]|nr:NAD(P)H-dependent glycerol-3-phosphate dehydrogenase [Dehalococcoidia bacterium]
MLPIAVLGATSWGVTIAWQLARNGHSVALLARTDTEARAVDARRGLARLPQVQLPASVCVQPAAKAFAAAALVVACPAQAVRESVASIGLRDVPVLSAAKGIEHGSRLRISELLRDEGWPVECVSVLSGPNLAHEIAAGLPAAAVVASYAEAEAAAWQQRLSGGAFRVYRSDDVIGVELGGALKNVIAIAAGAAAGLGFGANAIAAIMTRGLAEISRLGIALGAQPLTFQGLAGVGDLAATCFSPLSRNRRLGELLATGMSLDDAFATIGEAIEGAATAPVALELGHALNVQLPITEQVVAVLSAQTTIAEAMQALLARTLTKESLFEA